MEATRFATSNKLILSYLFKDLTADCPFLVVCDAVSVVNLQHVVMLLLY